MGTVLRWALTLVLIVWFINDPSGFGSAVGDAGTAVGSAVNGALDGK